MYKLSIKLEENKWNLDDDRKYIPQSNTQVYSQPLRGKIGNTYLKRALTEWNIQ